MSSNLGVASSFSMTCVRMALSISKTKLWGHCLSRGAVLAPRAFCSQTAHLCVSAEGEKKGQATFSRSNPVDAGRPAKATRKVALFPQPCWLAASSKARNVVLQDLTLNLITRGCGRVQSEICGRRGDPPRLCREGKPKLTCFPSLASREVGLWPPTARVRRAQPDRARCASAGGCEATLSLPFNIPDRPQLRHSSSFLFLLPPPSPHRSIGLRQIRVSRESERTSPEERGTHCGSAREESRN